MNSALTSHHKLTVADVLDLRASVRWRVNNGTLDTPDYPHLLWLAPEGTFLLRAYGRPMCQHQDIAVLGTLLRCERAEPGFIRRLCDSTEPPDLATLAPDERAEARRQLDTLRAEQRFRDAQAAEELRRRNSILAPNIAAMDLDDLLAP